MRLGLKTFFFISLFALSFTGWSYTSDYNSAFKPLKANKRAKRTLSSFSDNIKKDLLKVGAVINFKNKKVIVKKPPSKKDTLRFQQTPVAL